MSSVRSAVIFSSMSIYSMRILGLAWTMIVARLLTPSEIGTFAIASSLVMLMGEFKLLGAGSYLVREKEINDDKIRSALGLTMIMSWGLGGAIFIASPYIAVFYELPPVETIFRLLAVSFLIAPFISISTAILQRNFRFQALFYVKISAHVIGLTSTIAFILMGFSFYSLAFGQIIIALVEFSILFVIWPKGAPRFPSFKGLKPIVGLGIYTSLANMLNRGIVTAPDLVIGKLGSTHQAGIYSRGLGFMEFLLQSLVMGVTPVALPYLSQTQREKGDLGQAYIKASVLVGGLVCPVLAVAGLASLPAIRLFFGDQWDAAAPISLILAIWAMLRTVHWPSNPLLIANGNEKFMIVKESLIFFPFLAGIIFAYQFGLEAIAVAFVVSGVWEITVTSIILAKKIKLSFFRLFKAWLPNIVVTLVCGGTTYLISLMVDFGSSNFWKPILIIAAVMPPVYLATLKILSHPLFDELFGLFKMAVQKITKKA